MKKETSWLLKEKYPSTRLARSGQVLKYFEKDVQRLKAGEPIDYVIGFTEFLGCRIDLSYKPLIPRVETEFWAQKVIEDIRKSFDYAQDKTLRVLDIFAGSGCIGLAILKNIKNSKVIFAEIDKDCIKQIKINCRLNKIDKKRYKIIQSDVFTKVNGKYDFIFANPPYIPTKNKSKVQWAVLKFEPSKALFGRQDGLFFIKKFLKQAKNYLTENGAIYMEFDGSAGSPQVPMQKKQIENLLKNFGYKSWQFYKDQYGKWRYVMVK